MQYGKFDVKLWLAAALAASSHHVNPATAPERSWPPAVKNGSAGGFAPANLLGSLFALAGFAERKYH